MKPLAELPGWLQAAGWGILSVTTENHRRLGEQGAHNPLVAGSNPAGPTRSVREKS